MPLQNLLTHCLPPSRNQLIEQLADVNAALKEQSTLLSQLHQSIPALRSVASLGTIEAQDRVLQVLRLLQPLQVKGIAKARFGCAHDGGYVMLDDFEGVSSAISLGVEANASWDEAVADRGLTVFQFDHTIEAPPVTRGDLVFHRKKIAATPGPDVATIDELASQFTGGATSSILKMDIEHDEWPVFDAASDEALRCFSQIIVEFHGFGFIADPHWQTRARRVFEKLARQFAVFHVHSNNHCGINVVANVAFPEVLEISFANRNRYSLQQSVEVFPTDLDSPNDPDRADILLGSFHF